MAGHFDKEGILQETCDTCGEKTTEKSIFVFGTFSDEVKPEGIEHSIRKITLLEQCKECYGRCKYQSDEDLASFLELNQRGEKLKALHKLVHVMFDELIVCAKITADRLSNIETLLLKKEEKE